jgi:pre-mRNA-splicing factor 18
MRVHALLLFTLMSDQSELADKKQAVFDSDLTDVSDACGGMRLFVDETSNVARAHFVLCVDKLQSIDAVTFQSRPGDASCKLQYLQIRNIISVQALALCATTFTMDFASLMKSQIAASKPKNEQSSKKESDKKYLKRSEVENQRHAAYLADQAAAEALREEKVAKKRKLDEEAAERNKVREEKRRRLAEESQKRREEEEDREERERRKRVGLPEVPIEEKVEVVVQEESSDDEDLPDEEELVKQLRERDQPIKLFGETRKERHSRYWSVADPQVKTMPIPTTLRLVKEADMKVPQKLPKTRKERKLVRRQLASYFTLLLKEWIVALNSRSQDIKESSSGKTAYAAMLGAKNDLVLLFRRLEKDEVEDAVLQGVMDIVHAAQERRYVDANKKYILLSIGKA